MKNPPHLPSLLLFCVLSASCILPAHRLSAKPPPQSGKALYSHACAACHGADGTGAPSEKVGFDVPLPDFSDCNFASREADQDWMYVAVVGGPARGFSTLMPAFGDALSRQQIKKILGYMRTFCRNKNWPRGELNLPRPLVTTKAYPEDELVLSTAINTEGLDVITSEIIYEQRIGERNQFELVVPFGWREKDENGGTEWTSNLGDIGLGFKRVVYHSLEKGSILTFGGEMFFATGDEDEGFGSGTTVFEPYIAYGQILPAGFFAQFQAGAGLPWDDDEVNEEVFWRGAFGKAITVGEYGRRWSPMVEILGSEELDSEADTNWDVVPQLQVTLNHRQHVRLCAGARIPLNDTDTRETVYMVYLLWDWFDGPFFAGW